MSDLSKHESPAVMKHLEFLMSIIERMASNSASCKTWAIMVVTALIALSNILRIPRTVLIMPIISFYLLDAYYLGLEKKFRAMYDDFVAKLGGSNLSLKDLYLIKPNFSISRKMGFFIKGAFSVSTWLIYVVLLVFMLLLKTYVKEDIGDGACIEVLAYCLKY